MAAKNVIAPGVHLTRNTQNLPQTATANLFTNTGTCLVTGLFGRVTTSLGATATSLSLGTTISGTAIATATAVTSLVSGSFLVPTQSAGVGGALLLSSAPFLPNDWPGFWPFLIAPFAEITWTTTANDTGQIQWELYYIPVDSGAAFN